MDHDQDDFNFDDPGLQGAVRSVWGGETAPQRLRGRVSHLIATAGSIDDAAGSNVARPLAGWQLWASRVYALAAAAVLIFAIGLLALYYQGALNIGSLQIAMVEPARLAPTRTAMPIELARSLVATHAACAKLPDLHVINRPTGPKTYSELTLKLTADLGFPVVARPVGGDWRFLGAGECKVGELRVSHLMFGRGAEVVSVFSLPAQCMSGCQAGAQYDGLFEGLPVAGFARPGAAYAIVGSSSRGSLSLQTVAAIRDGLFGSFYPEACGEGTGGLELID